jgi:hypothetical protein
MNYLWEHVEVILQSPKANSQIKTAPICTSLKILHNEKKILDR